MIRRSLTTLSLLVLASAPLSAQADKDPTHKVAGKTPLPAGWSGRTDRPNDKLSDAKFVTMGSGFHVTSGPAAIYWNAHHTAAGPFVATASLTQTKAPMHPEAYGIIFMGKKLDAADQSYMYFIVRQDGKFMVNHRAGAEVHKLVPWTDHAAVHKADAAGKATNALTVDASKADSVRLLVNGTQVHALPANQFGGTDGLVGLRVNHNLDVHVGEFSLTPKK
ncbi:MAG: hypothetical protein ABIP93_02180 [Gemmatimonadaceae bacterium]